MMPDTRASGAAAARASAATVGAGPGQLKFMNVTDPARPDATGPGPGRRRAASRRRAPPRMAPGAGSL